MEAIIFVLSQRSINMDEKIFAGERKQNYREGMREFMVTDNTLASPRSRFGKTKAT
jgi:hypothetical protein